MDDGEGLRSTLDAMAIVGILEAEREAVLRTVAAVLHLGNVTFAGAPDEGSALGSRSAQEALAACADLLRVRACLLRLAGCCKLLLLLARTSSRLAPACPVLQTGMLAVCALNDCRDTRCRTALKLCEGWQCTHTMVCANLGVMSWGRASACTLKEGCGNAGMRKCWLKDYRVLEGEG